MNFRVNSESFEVLEMSEEEAVKRQLSMIDAEAAEDAMIKKDFDKLHDAVAGGQMLIPMSSSPGVMTDRGLSNGALAIAVKASGAPLECGWSAEAMDAVFGGLDSSVPKCRELFKELADAGYAVKVYDGENEDGAYARYQISTTSRIPETRKYAVTSTPEDHPESEVPGMIDKLKSLAGTELAKGDTVLIYTDYNGEPIDLKPFIIHDSDHSPDADIEAEYMEASKTHSNNDFEFWINFDIEHPTRAATIYRMAYEALDKADTPCMLVECKGWF